MDPIQVYIAAPFPLKPVAEMLRHGFLAAGAEVCAHWITQPPEAQESHEEALHDLLDIEHADVFVGLNPLEWGERGTGGRHVELGYALCLGTPVVMVGVKTNVFHHLSGLTWVESGNEAVALVMERWKGRVR